MLIRPVVRDHVAKLIRALPPFRGKGPLIRLLSRVLISPGQEGSLATVRIADGSALLLDVRSSTEATAYWAGGYDTDVIARLSEWLKPGCVILDVGANVGFYSAPLGRKAMSLGGHLYAFEPIPSNFARLQHVIQLNDLSSTVSAFCLALGDRDGDAEFWLDDRDPAGTGNAVLVQGAVGRQLTPNTTSRMVRLDDFAAKQGIERCDLIKVDIEGAELLFLRGAQELIQRTRPVIYGEFSAYWMQKYGHRFRDVVDLVEPWEYRFHRWSGRSGFVAMQAGEEAENVLLVPEDKQEKIRTSDTR